MHPLAVHKEFVLVLSFREVQDSDEVVVAVQREETWHTTTPVMLWTLPFRGVPKMSTLRAPARPKPLGARLQGAQEFSLQPCPVCPGKSLCQTLRARLCGQHI